MTKHRGTFYVRYKILAYPVALILWVWYTWFSLGESTFDVTWKR